jgi:hypothetical protein
MASDVTGRPVGVVLPNAGANIPAVKVPTDSEGPAGTYKTTTETPGEGVAATVFDAIKTIVTGGSAL